MQSDRPGGPLRRSSSLSCRFSGGCSGKPEPTTRRRATVRPARVITTTNRSMRVLLVEDDRLLGDGIRAGLRQLGFQVDWVRDGEAAESELRAQPYAAALLDLGLPRKEGLAVLSNVRKLEINVPVLVLTARDAV